MAFGSIHSEEKTPSGLLLGFYGRRLRPAVKLPAPIVTVDGNIQRKKKHCSFPQ